MITRKTLIRLFLGASCILTAVSVGVYDYLALKWRKAHVTAQITPEMETGEEEYIPPGPSDETLEVKRGDTLSSVLERAGISSDQANSAIDALTSVFNPRELRPEHELYITYTTPEDDILKKDLLKLYLKIAIDLELIVERDDNGQFAAQKIVKELVHEHRAIEGTIEESLFLDASKQGAHPKILNDMIASFLHEVDFQRDFQPGDQFGLFYETYKEPESLQEKPGKLLFAYLNLQGRVYKIYFFKPKNGVAQFYNALGDSIKKGLMRTPIDGARLTSSFGKRHHPILGYTKMHKGVDFAAPVGTPVMASGDGRIVKIGPYSSYGNYILIQHPGVYCTAYAHLSRFARGLKTGCAVRQGQIIGYVGRTGRCTGPHLHYELLKAGVQINPKHIKMLPTGKLKGKDLQEFVAVRSKIDHQYTHHLKAQKNAVQEPIAEEEPAQLQPVSATTP